VADLRDRLAATAAPFDGAVPDLDALREQANRSAELTEQISGLRAEAKHLEAARADLERDAAALEAAAARLAELDRQEAELAFEPEEHQRLAKERAEAARLLEAGRAEERRASETAARAGAEVATLEARIREVEQIRARVGGLQDDARYLDRVSTLLEGFRIHLYGRIIPELSGEAQALFAELTSRAYDDLRIDPETLAIEIADGERYYPIERFSGSESDLANLALRVAISTHLSRMSGADVGMLVLDEVLASLDVERKDLFVRTMGRLASRFHQLFVITHAEQAAAAAWPCSAESAGGWPDPGAGAGGEPVASLGGRGEHGSIELDILRGHAVGGDEVDEGLDARGVEEVAAPGDEVGQGLVGRPRRPVGTVRGQGVPDVGHRGDPGHQWGFLAGPVIGIAAPVPPLVVVADHVERGAQRRRATGDLPPHHGMGADPVPLLGRQALRLVQHSVGDADLADVVQPGALSEPTKRVGVQAESLPDAHGHSGHPTGVPVRVGVLGLDGGGERVESFRGAPIDVLEGITDRDAAHGLPSAPALPQPHEHRPRRRGEPGQEVGVVVPP
jgi:hypothetical protein